VSAIEESSAVAEVGKGTSVGIQPSAGESTRALTDSPHAPYADAIHAALRAIEVLPDLVETGLRVEVFDGQRELFIRVEWLPGHDDLIPAPLRALGLVVQWSHLAGWSVRSGDDVAGLERTDDLADPAVIADIAMHAVLHGLSCTCERPDPGGRWEFALELDIALVNFEERP
jgi:hypothetical protein